MSNTCKIEEQIMEELVPMEAIGKKIGYFFGCECILLNVSNGLALGTVFSGPGALLPKILKFSHSRIYYV